jgi:hypothetical protein
MARFLNWFEQRLPGIRAGECGQQSWRDGVSSAAKEFGDCLPPVR